MIKREKYMKWKPVLLDEAFIKHGIDGLVGIEELTEYDVDTVRLGSSRQVKSAKKKDSKKKTTENESEDTKKRKRKLLEEPDTNLSLKVAKKLKHTKKNKSKCKKDEDSECANIIAEDSVDSNSITGMEAWSALHVPPPVLRSLAELGFKKPTEIQALVLPPAILGRRDILGAAETGSGKTLAFGIPIIHGILEQKKEEFAFTSPNQSNEENEYNTVLRDTSVEGVGCVKVIDNLEPVFATRKKLYALILTPTRELAIQVRNHLVAAANGTDIKVAVVVGGMSSQKQERILKRGPEIVVATPGRLWELIEEHNPHLGQVNDIRFLAIDETDRMLERGHFLELQTLLERINEDETKKKLRQNFVFSATLTLVHEQPKHVKKGKRKALNITPWQKLQSIISMLGITNPKVVDVTQSTGTAGTLSEARILCPLEEKDLYLYYLLQKHPGRTLVFCNSISCVRRLAHLLGLLQCKPLPLHANMIQRQRLKNLERFSDNSDSLLLATDVAARGLDIPNVEHVIHYQVPRTSEGYVHRSGRTARAQKEGLTILLIEPTEVPYYTRLCRTLGRDKDIPVFPVVDSLFLAVKERVQLAREVDKLELVSRRNNAETSWFQKAMHDMDVILDKDELPQKFSDSTTAKIKRQATAKRKQLNKYLSRPLIPKSLSGKYLTKSGRLESSNAVQTLKRAFKPGKFVRRRQD